MPTQLINGLTYHYDLSGPADNPSGAPTLVLLHGFTGSAANWRDVAPALAQTHRVLAVDLLGHGETDAPADHARYAMAHTARDLVDLLTVTVGQPVHLLGYSMGGRLALYTALHFGEAVASLILESASPGLRTQVERAERRDRDEALAERIEREGGGGLCGFLGADSPLCHAGEVATRRACSSPRAAVAQLGARLGEQPARHGHERAAFAVG